MIALEIWLYGSLATYAAERSQGSHAQLNLEVPIGTSMRDLLAQLGMPREEKGITFINGQLTDMPGLGADLDWKFKHGDRVGIFHRQSMWPFQYRFGASISSTLQDASKSRESGLIFHSSTSPGSDTEKK